MTTQWTVGLRRDVLQLVEALSSYQHVRDNFRGKETYVRALTHYGQAVLAIQSRIGITVLEPGQVHAAITVARMEPENELP